MYSHTVFSIHTTRGDIEKISSTQLSFKSRKACWWRSDFNKESNKTKAASQIAMNPTKIMQHYDLFVASAKVSHRRSLYRRDVGDVATSESKRHRSKWLRVSESVADAIRLLYKACSLVTQSRNTRSRMYGRKLGEHVAGKCRAEIHRLHGVVPSGAIAPQAGRWMASAGGWSGVGWPLKDPWEKSWQRRKPLRSTSASHPSTGT